MRLSKETSVYDGGALSEALTAVDVSTGQAVKLAREAKSSASEVSTKLTKEYTSSADLAASYSTKTEVENTADRIKSEVAATYATASSVSTLEQTAADLTASVKQNAEGVGELESLVRVSGEGVEVARKVDGAYTSTKTVVSASGMEVVDADGSSLASFGAATRIGTDGVGANIDIGSDAMRISIDGDDYAYLSADKWYTQNAEVSDAFYIGDYSLRTGSDGRFIIGLRR